MKKGRIYNGCCMRVRSLYFCKLPLSPLLLTGNSVSLTSMLVHNLLYDNTMDCYRHEDVGNEFSSQLADMLPSELDFFQRQTDVKEDMTSYAPTMLPTHVHHDSYSNGSQDSYGSGSHGYVPPMDCPRPDYAQKYATSLPQVDSPAVDWLQRVSTCPSAHPIGSNTASVHGAPTTTKPLDLPVQISGSNINYMSRASSAQPMYMSASSAQPVYMSPSIPTDQQDGAESEYRSRSNSNNSSYALSPGATAAENPFPKPAYSYSCLIALALKNSQHGSLPVAEIYSFMTRHFPYFKTAPDGWKNSVRHNLSLNKCFEKIENPNADGTNSRKGCLWALNPAKVKKMDEEIFKWNKKDPLAIKRAMVHPEVLERLSKGQESFSSRASTMRHRQHQHVHHEPRMSIMETVTSARAGSINGMPSPVNQPPHMYMDQSSPAPDVFSGRQQMDVSPSDISMQNGLFDGLPAELLEYVYNPASFSTAASTSSCHAGQVTTELPAVQNSLPPAALISLAQN